MYLKKKEKLPSISVPETAIDIENNIVSEGDWSGHGQDPLQFRMPYTT